MNKSDHIRQYFSLNPSAAPKEAHRALMAQGLKVSPALIRRIKYGAKGLRKMKRRGGPRKAVVAVNGANELLLDHLLAAKKLVQQLGSVESAKQAVDALARLS